MKTQKEIIEHIAPYIHRNVELHHATTFINTFYFQHIVNYVNDATVKRVFMVASPYSKTNQITVECENAPHRTIGYKDLASFIITNKRKPVNKTDEVKRALRTTARSSPLSLQYPKKDGYEVDHCGAYEFADIIERFLETVSVEFLYQHIRHDRYGIRYFNNDIIISAFHELHDSLAELQYLTHEQHKAKTKKSRQRKKQIAKDATVTRLEAENKSLRARVAELERALTNH